MARCYGEKFRRMGKVKVKERANFIALSFGK